MRKNENEYYAQISDLYIVTSSENLSDALRKRFELPIAWAVRVVRQLADQPDVSIWRQVWDTAGQEKRRQLAMVLGMLAFDETMKPKLLGGRNWTPVFEDWFQEARGYLDKPAIVHTSTSMSSGALGEFYDQFSQILQGKATSEELLNFTENLRRERSELLAGNPEEEVDGLLVDGLHHLGLAYTRQEDQQGAISSLKEAIKIADAATQVERATLSRATLAQVYLRGTRDINAALRLALPLWEKSQTQEVSLPLVDLTMTLAETYQQTGDGVETAFFETAAERMLIKLDCPLETETPVSEALEGWVASLPPEDLQPNYVMKLLKSCLIVYARLARLREGRLGEGEAAKFWGGRFREITEVENQVTRVLMEQSAHDNILMQEIGFLDRAEEQPEDSLSQAEMMGLQQTTDDFRTRLDAGDFGDDIVREMESTLETSTLRENPLLAMSIQWLLAECLCERGDNEKAAPYFEQAIATAIALERLDDGLYTLSLQIGYLAETDYQLRIKLCQRAINLIEAARKRVGTPYQQSAFLHDKTHFYSLVLLDAFKTRNWDLLLSTGTYLKARPPVSFPGPEENEVIFSSALNQLQDKINGSDRGANIQEPALRRKRQRLYDNWLLSQNREEGDDPERQPVSTQQVFRRLDPHEALITYYQLSDEVWLVLAMNGRGELLAARQIAKANWLPDMVAEVNHFGRRPNGYRARGMVPYDGFTSGLSLLQRTARRIKRRQQLADWLLPEEIHPVLRGCTRLYLCPHRVLHQLAFHALPWEGGFLIETFAVSYLPSLLSLKGRLPSTSEGVVLVGTQDYADGAAFGLTSLPGAAAEIAGLTNYYQNQDNPVHTFLESAATREKLLSPEPLAAMSKARIIHLALHAEDVPGDAPMDARLFLNKGTMDGFDIAQWRLQADLVILSACYAGLRPAGSRGLAFMPGDDLFGFQAAFFAAGARQLLGALWPVDDSVGKELMMVFHEKLSGADAAVAWQHTVIQYLKGAEEEQQRPLYWAPFFLVEEGRRN